MMKKILAPLAVCWLAATPALAAPEVGKAAPDFTATSASGKTVKLSDYAGKIVVLEWNNPGCPFVKKFYGSGAMQKQQAAATAKGIVWLSVNSGAEGNQGHMNGEEALAFVADKKAAPTEYLLDCDGTIGHLYGAKTTPHMFVIDNKGKLVYAGAIDDKAGVNPDEIATAHNYVDAAIAAIMAEKTPEVTTTQSYGCSVKY